jgi:hypothetical protein
MEKREFRYRELYRGSYTLERTLLHKVKKRREQDSLVTYHAGFGRLVKIKLLFYSSPPLSSSDFRSQLF